MAGRNKEIDVLIIDVGPAMREWLPALENALGPGYMLSKILHKPTHEVAIVLFGTTGTGNALNDEMAEAGDPDSYKHVTVVQEVGPPGVATGHLQKVGSLERGTGASDFVDALAVALDMCIKIERSGERTGFAKLDKKFIVVSNFGHPAAELEESFCNDLINSMKENKITLSVVCLPAAPPLLIAAPPTHAKGGGGGGGSSQHRGSTQASGGAGPTQKGGSQASAMTGVTSSMSATPCGQQRTPVSLAPEPAGVPVMGGNGNGGGLSLAARERARDDALGVLDGLLAEAGDRDVKLVSSPAQLLSAFQQGVAAQCIKQNLVIGDGVVLRTRIYKKVGFESVPNISQRALGSDGHSVVGLKRERECFVVPADADMDDNEDRGDGSGAGPSTGRGGLPADAEPVTMEDQMKAYRYGKQVIPIDTVMESEMKYLPGKCLMLLGFVDRDTLMTDLRFLLMKDPQVVLPEQNECSQLALSALVRAAHAKGRAAIARYARTDKTPVVMVALLPQLGSLTVPDHFTQVQLPFAEDIRDFMFPPLVPRKELLPSAAQEGAARSLVQAMDLGTELLRPEDTANPSIVRFYAAVLKLVMGAQEEPGREAELLSPINEDVLVCAALRPPWGEMPNALPAADAFYEALPVLETDAGKGAEGASAAVDGAPLLEGGEALGVGVGGAQPGGGVTLRDDSPVEDFRTAAEAGRLRAAVAALSERVTKLVDGAIKGRTYPTAVEYVSAMRSESVSHRDADSFNASFRALAERYRGDAAHGGFWTAVLAKGLRLVSGAEVAGCGVSAAEAESFGAAAAAVASVAEAEAGGSAAPTAMGDSAAQAMQIDDDLDDME